MLEKFGEIRRRQRHDNLSIITHFVITHLGILNLTSADNLFTAIFYVAYRSQHPDKATVLEVLEKLIDNHIDVYQLMEFSTDHCQ